MRTSGFFISLLIIVCSYFGFTANARESDGNLWGLYIQDVIAWDVDQEPEFPGGIEALSRWILDNFKIPRIEDVSEFDVTLEFLVEEDGTVADARIYEGYEKDFDLDLLQLFSAMPKWKPARNNGESTATLVLLPITFFPNIQMTTEIRIVDVVEEGHDYDIVAVEADILPPSEPEEDEPEKIFNFAEQSPSFPGGEEALIKWISNNILYPQSAQQNGIQGRVIVEYVVEKDGQLTNLKILKGADPDLDKEALRLIRKMPRWKPAKNYGAPVRCRHALPINFKLSQ